MKAYIAFSSYLVSLALLYSSFNQRWINTNQWLSPSFHPLKKEKVPHQGLITVTLSETCVTLKTLLCLKRLIILYRSIILLHFDWRIISHSCLSPLSAPYQCHLMSYENDSTYPSLTVRTLHCMPLALDTISIIATLWEMDKVDEKAIKRQTCIAILQIYGSHNP